MVKARDKEGMGGICSIFKYATKWHGKGLEPRVNQPVKMLVDNMLEIFFSISGKDTHKYIFTYDTIYVHVYI